MKNFFLLISFIFLTPFILSAQTSVGIVYESSDSGKYSNVYVKNNHGTKISVTIAYRLYDCSERELGKVREMEKTLYAGSKIYLGQDKTYCVSTNRYHDNDYRIKSWDKKD